jgi:hypothetical protein
LALSVALVCQLLLTCSGLFSGLRTLRFCCTLTGGFLLTLSVALFLQLTLPRLGLTLLSGLRFSAGSVSAGLLAGSLSLTCLTCGILSCSAGCFFSSICGHIVSYS